MIPAYTKYEFVNRIIIPGAMTVATATKMLIPESNNIDLAVVVSIGCFPTGYMLDIFRDWLAFSIYFITKKCKLFSILFPKLIKYFKEFFFYLEKTHSISSKEASIINYKFFFSLNTEERYYLSVRQAWASFTTNTFTAFLILNFFNLTLSYIRNSINIYLTISMLILLIFFYYAGIYRLISISKTYNILLEEYYQNNYKNKGI